MNLLQGKGLILNLFAITALTVGAGYVITGNEFTANTELVRFSDLTDADIDMILAVKNEMYEAKIRSN